MERVEFNAGVSFRYPVYLTRNAFGADNPILADFVRNASTVLPADVLVILDEGVATAHPHCTSLLERYFHAHRDAIELAGPILVVPGGEAVKNDPRHLDAIHRAIYHAGLCRQSYVLAVGGGAVLDATGYAAATAHRGIRLIRMPTTVLSQDDSAVGVKNGVNAFGRKNYFGTFAPPAVVINDFTFLPTLLDRDWLGGLSEAVKVALVKDAGFFEALEAHAASLVARALPVMEEVVRQSATLHLQHIERGGDPFETGSSRPLDFGHWAAHKLEQLTDYRLRHGEAVAVGIALDATYSRLSGALPEQEWRRVVDLLTSLRLPIVVPELVEHLRDARHPRSVLRGLEEFREHLGGRLTVMLLSSIGRAFDVHEIDTEVMIESAVALQALDAGRPAPAAAGTHR